AAPPTDVEVVAVGLSEEVDGVGRPRQRRRRGGTDVFDEPVDVGPDDEAGLEVLAAQEDGHGVSTVQAVDGQRVATGSATRMRPGPDPGGGVDYYECGRAGRQAR